MREAQGEPIGLCDRQQGWSDAAQTLAIVQMRFRNESGLLRRMGCRDRSIAWVESKFEPFFQEAEAWMARQPAGTAAQPLTPAELRTLSNRVRGLIAEICDLGIPETLVHGDINSGNLISSPERCVFLDWAEAWISHPFVSFEYLKELLGRTHPTRANWLQDLRSAYAEPWRSLNGHSVVDRALRMSPALAALVYALACADPPCHLEPLPARPEPFLRTLLRRID